MEIPPREFFGGGVLSPAHKEEIVHRGGWSHSVGGDELWILSYLMQVKEPSSLYRTI